MADILIKIADGDPHVLELLLQLAPDTLGNNPYRVDFTNPTGLRIPTGNEGGANDKWIAGGFTGSGFMGRGVPEAIIDPAPAGTYTSRPVWGK